MSDTSPWDTDDEWPEPEMLSGLDYWRLCEDLTIVQAALLIAGRQPTRNNEYHAERTTSPPLGYEAAREAVRNTLGRGAVKGRIVQREEENFDGTSTGPIPGSVDIHRSHVDVESLRAWLASRGMRTGFFFPTEAAAPDYLNPKHPRYAPKLAAAVSAWLATEDESTVKGKSPKQALTKWLREQATKFGLTDDDGKPNETGIEEAAKVANWQPGGGAPKTPAT